MYSQPLLYEKAFHYYYQYKMCKHHFFATYVLQTLYCIDIALLEMKTEKIDD